MQGNPQVRGGVQHLIDGTIGTDTAVILDSGAAHSVAMAVRLAENGYQPVVMFDSIPHPEGITRSEQGLATLLYFAEKVNQLKEQGVIKADAPPVFILDTHRSNTSLKAGKAEYDNTYAYASTDFPSAEELQQHGIAKIVYLNEGDQEGRINSSYQSINRLEEDLKPLARDWESKGIKMLYTGISPWKETSRATNTTQNSSFSDSLNYPRHVERRLNYASDIPPSVYGESSGIAMHKNRQRFVLTHRGELMTINEFGISRDLTEAEKVQFRDGIEQQISAQPDNQDLKTLYEHFPKDET